MKILWMQCIKNNKVSFICDRYLIQICMIYKNKVY